MKILNILFSSSIDAFQEPFLHVSLRQSRMLDVDGYNNFSSGSIQDILADLYKHIFCST
jgi:hypothetical protein